MHHARAIRGGATGYLLELVGAYTRGAVPRAWAACLSLPCLRGCSVILGLCPRFQRTRAGARRLFHFKRLHRPRWPWRLGVAARVAAVHRQRALVGPGALQRVSSCLCGAGLQAFTLKSGGQQGFHAPSAVSLPVPAIRPLHASTQGPRGVFPDLQPGHPF